VLRIVGVSEQTYYYNKNKKSVKRARRGKPQPGYSLNQKQQRVSDEQIKEWLLELVSGEESIYGYRKLTICLRNQYELIINKKKVYRLCKELDILHPKRRQRLAPRKIARNREVSASNQLWEMDIKYAYIAGENRFFFLLNLIDVFDRSIVDYHIGLSCEGKDAAQVLHRALFKRQLFEQDKRPVIRTDNGPQFISHVFQQACATLGVEHERIPPKTPNLNAHIESYHSQLERDCLSRQEFSSYAEAYESVMCYVDFYNHRRIHGSLYDLAPYAFIQAIQNQQVKPFIVRV
jgi:putative transposase